MKKLFFSVFLSIFLHTIGVSQSSDDAFKQPLKDVLAQIQKQYGIAIRYDEALIKDKWVTYAGWRFRPDVEKTLSNVLASQDINFAKEGDKKYKLQTFQYHLKTVEEGKQQLEYLATLYNDQRSWEKRKAELKSCILSALRLSNMPARPASKPIITAVRKFDGYTVENIAIETLPGLYVGGSLYRPAKIKGKVPIVLNPDGHFSKGRYREDCQYRCAILARMGAMAFSYDLFGWDGESLLQIKSTDHRRALVQSIQALNATRILDYLLTLNEADPTRVAITGASGGGSQTMLMAAIDDRIDLSVPVAMTSSYHSGGCPCESGMGVHLCRGGTNNVEIAAMAAPRPQLIVSDGKDWTQNVPQNEFPFLQRTYNFYGKSDVVKNAHLPTEGHDYGVNKRKAMYEFISQQFSLKINAADESKVTIEKETALYVFGDKGERLPANALKGFDEVAKVFEAAVAGLNYAPMVNDTIEARADLQPSYQSLLRDKIVFDKKRPVTREHPVVIELVKRDNQPMDFDKLKQLLTANKVNPTSIYQWRNHYVVFDKVQDVSVVRGKLQNAFPGVQIKIYYEPFYDFNRRYCSDTTTAKEWEHIILTANLVTDSNLQKEYIDFHATQFEKWPEVSKGFCNANFQQLLVYRSGRQLMLVISIPKGESLDKLNPRTAENNPRVDQWNALMKKYQEGIEGTKPGETWVFFEKVTDK